MFETLQSIVDQLEFVGYQTEDGVHELKMNRAFIALKEMAASENIEDSKNSTLTPTNNERDVICSNSICHYCESYVGVEKCNVCNFIGRKLTPVS